MRTLTLVAGIGELMGVMVEALEQTGVKTLALVAGIQVEVQTKS